MQKFATNIILAILIGSMLIPVSNEPLSSTLSLKVMNSSNYTWIWDELLDPSLPGSISGDDSVYWGSSLGPYYNSTETINKLKAAASFFPDLVQYFTIGKSYLGKDIAGVKITAPVNSSIYAKYEFTIVGAHHAREAITVVDTLFFMDRLLYNYLNNDSWTMALLTQAEIYIVPMFNPDGVDYLYINPWQRKNMHPIDEDGDGSVVDESEIRDLNGDFYVEEYFDPDLGLDIYESADGSDNDTTHGEDNPGGVDLNRNYPYEFYGSGSSTNPRDETYRGSGPLSEPETQAWASFAQEHHFFSSLSLHSGIQAIIYPWGYTSLPPPDEDTFVTIANTLKQISGFPTWDEIGGYGVNGEWGDWMYGALDSLAFTIETYGNPSSYRFLRRVRGIDRYGGIWNYFNPDANDIYDTTVFGVQPQIDYLASIALQGVVPPEFSMGNVLALSNGTHLSVNFSVNVDVDGLNASLEFENQTSLGWVPVASVPLNTSISEYQLNIPYSDGSNVRLYVGSGSQGYSVYFNVTNAPVQANVSLTPISGKFGPVDVGVRPSPSTATSSSLTPSNSTTNTSSPTMPSLTPTTSTNLISTSTLTSPTSTPTTGTQASSSKSASLFLLPWLIGLFIMVYWKRKKW